MTRPQAPSNGSLGKVQSTLSDNSSPPSTALADSIDFATHLTHWIQASAWTESRPFPDPEIYMAALPLQRNEVSPQDRVQLDQHAVKLWNCCSNVDRDGLDDSTKMNIVQAQALAYFLLESALNQKLSTISRAFRTGCRAVRDCISCGMLKLAAQIVTHLADLQRKLQDADPNSNSPTSRADFLLLRILLSWRESRYDMAEHFYATLISEQLMTDAEQVAKASDLFYEIGTGQFRSAHYETAVRWLRRGCDLFDTNDAALAISGSEDIKLNILHTLVRALLACDSPQAREEASTALARLKQEYGSKLAVRLLQLEILSHDPDSHPDAYLAELTMIIRTVHLTESNHKIILHHSHQLKEASLACALTALKLYIIQRLMNDCDHQRTESTVVTYVWMACLEQAPHPPMAPSDLTSDFDSFHTSWNASCSPEAAGAILLLLWKQMDRKSSPADSSHLRDWCILALHPLLAQAGHHNIGKVQRRLVQCHMTIPDYEAAKCVLDNMQPSVRQHPLSLFLSCSLALRCRDEIASDAALAHIARLGQKDHQVLFASIAETMEYGTKTQAVALLQRVLDKFNYDLPDDMDTCTMLRCTAQLIISVLAEDNPVDPEMLSRLCAVFRAAAAYSVKSNAKSCRSPALCSLQECRWFEKTAYNVAVEHLHQWPAKVIIDLMAYVDQIQYPSTVSPNILRDKRKLHISTTYIRCILSTTEARRCDADWTIDDIPRTSYTSKERPTPASFKDHLYRTAFACYETLRELLDNPAEASEPTIDRQTLDDLHAKVTDLLPLVFEASLFVSETLAAEKGSFDQMNLVAIIDRASKLEAGPKVYASFADAILSAFLGQDPSGQAGKRGMPLSCALHLLQKVIQAMTKRDDYDTDQAARWIRCVVQIVLDHRDGDEHLSLLETTVDQALALARISTGEVDGMDADQQLYPAEELHWLSSALFNLGIDLYCEGDRQAAQRWMENAVDVADVMAGVMSRQDGGDTTVGLSLAKTMRARMAKLGL